ncbi:hypothetical protein BK674_17310 [Pseudomonas moraviensis]|jgi:hypothetical protein|uniref:Uncharacterized protein n=1 Tax=Pseudomonas moraviensis TaxID=321662 RepID=A0A423NLZ2_9PSED|nr:MULTISPECIES: hypothetical protein [Pseudomonas]KPG82648.1 hypothetical protein AEQ63_12055 [Pseudomonas sp. RIT-PI-o]RON99201.1 hypothetical protein BK674_17310 [Pseudomonas moraviensis]
MDWKFTVTTLVALLAVLISWRARREVKVASKATLELQSRLEHYQHFPIIQVSIVPNGHKVKVILTNVSAQNAVSSYKLRFILRITAGKSTFSVSKEDYVYNGGFLGPNSVEEISPAEINDCIADAISPLQKYPSEQNHFVLRVYAECTPPHPKSEKVIEQGVGYFAYENNQLKLVPGPK